MQRKRLGIKERRRKKRANYIEEGFRIDPDYGKVPLIKLERGGWAWDFDFQSEMPKGAMRGNLHAQHFCAWCHCPKYFYVDQKSDCVQCGEPFVFSASEQKYWYETRKFSFYSKPYQRFCNPTGQKDREMVKSAAERAKQLADLIHLLVEPDRNEQYP